MARPSFPELPMFKATVLGAVGTCQRLITTRLRLFTTCSSLSLVYQHAARVCATAYGN